MDWKTERKRLMWIIAIFLVCFWLPVGNVRFRSAVLEALYLVRWYARTHIVSSLVPAFFIAGAIATFINKTSVMRYLEAGANRILAYGVASVSGAILPVCSCMVLPLFAGIRRMGAGLGPACAFLYSGPAVNVLAIILTGRILGAQLGVARALGGIGFSISIGLVMHLIYRKEEQEKVDAQMAASKPETQIVRPLWQNVLVLISMVGILSLANWVRTGDMRAVFLCCPHGLAAFEVEGELVNRTDTAVTVRDRGGKVHEISTDVLREIRPVEKNSIYEVIYALRWSIVLLILAAFLWMLHAWFRRDELEEWVKQSWGYAKQILPILLAGILVSGFLLGRPGHDGVIPSRYVALLVGANPEAFLQVSGWAGSGLENVVRLVWPLWTNLFASMLGAFMYFSTLTEVPILQGLIGAGMGQGPAPVVGGPRIIPAEHTGHSQYHGYTQDPCLHLTRRCNSQHVRYDFGLVLPARIKTI
jgi:uncharacterized protein